MPTFASRWTAWPLMDNVFIERLWRSLKYECVFLNAFETGGEARTGNRSLDRLLQPAASALGARRQDARRGLCYRNPAGEFGGLKPAGPTLAKPPPCLRDR